MFLSCFLAPISWTLPKLRGALSVPGFSLPGVEQPVLGKLLGDKVTWGLEAEGNQLGVQASLSVQPPELGETRQRAPLCPCAQTLTL